MIKSIFRWISSASLVVLYGGMLAWGGTAYSAVAPVVSTLSAISEGSVTPVRVAADPYGNYYVTDPRGGGVLKYNSAGSLLQTITTTSKNILGIALAQNGDILVSQGTGVAVYSSAGAYQFSFGTFGMANGISVDDNGAVYVADSKNNNIQVFNAAYALVTTFGSTGSAPGQFKQPTGITFEKVSRQVAVADTLNGRVQFFTTAGVYQKTVGSFGSGPLKFTSPQAIAFEYVPSGSTQTLSRMYVVDSFQANVQVIDAASSSFLSYVGSYGLRSGQLVTPGDVLLDSFNRLVIPNGTGSLALFGVEGSSSGSSTGGAVISFPSTGSSAPALVLTTLGTGMNTISSITKTGAITVAGTVAPAGSTVTVNGTAAAVDANGNWSSGVVLTHQGLNNIVISASSSGSTSSLSAYITLDTVVPVVTTTAIPPTGSTTNAPVQTISGAVSDTTAASVTVSVANGSQTASQTVPVNNGVFTTAIILARGSNTITVTATDAAGSSTTSSSTVTYDPLAPAVTVATPGGAVSGSASYTVAGTAPVNCTVTVNGVPATVSGTQWTATIPLVSGVNPISVTATVLGNTVIATLSSSVTYAPGQPSLAVTVPAADSGTAKASSVISGIASSGASVTASLNGVAIPVTIAPDGSFSVSLPAFTAAGSYAIAITAIDSNGKTSSTARTLVYDPVPAVLTVADATPATIKISTSKGIVIAKDKNGLIASATNGTSSLDLTGATGATGAAIDTASLNIYALTPTGVSSRDGDINGDGKVDIADALLAAQISLGTAPAATFEQKLRGDVGPLVNHLPVPDGKIRLDDAILILQKSIGIDW